MTDSPPTAQLLLPLDLYGQKMNFVWRGQEDIDDNVQTQLESMQRLRGEGDWSYVKYPGPKDEGMPIVVNKGSEGLKKYTVSSDDLKARNLPPQLCVRFVQDIYENAKRSTKEIGMSV